MLNPAQIYARYFKQIQKNVLIEEFERGNQLLKNQCAYSEKITADAKVVTEFDHAYSEQNGKTD
jgi:hypothetical protein